MARRQIFFLAIFLSSAPITSANAKSPDVDWKLYGSASFGTAGEKCFYDAAGVKAQADNLIRVWVKCLSQSDIDRIDIEHDYDGKILKRAAQRIVSKYIPPLATITDISFDDATAVVAAEQIADVTFLEPTARIFYELDCSERKLHELSLNIHNRSADTARPWSYAAPETNADRLLKLLCR